MSELNTVDSSLVTWYVIDAGDSENQIRSFCADGDGILQVVVYADKIELSDQGDSILTWDAGADMGEILEAAQAYLQENYPAIYEDAMHWNNDCEQDLFYVMNSKA